MKLAPTDFLEDEAMMEIEEKLVKLERKVSE